jgi:hypothetical protein
VTPRVAAIGALGLGVLAVVVAMALGSSVAVADAVIHPPPIVRAGLVGGSVAIGLILLTRALTRISEASADVRGLIRGVRLVFLAVAAFAAAAGWALGHPLPLLVALVIAGIDVIETSFLLLVVGEDRR